MWLRYIVCEITELIVGDIVLSVVFVLLVVTVVDFFSILGLNGTKNLERCCMTSDKYMR